MYVCMGVRVYVYIASYFHFYFHKTREVTNFRRKNSLCVKLVLSEKHTVKSMAQKLEEREIEWMYYVLSAYIHMCME